MITSYGRKMLEFLRVLEAGPREPWGGRSPRSLTRGSQIDIFESQDDDVKAIFDDQVVEDQERRFFNGS